MAVLLTTSPSFARAGDIADRAKAAGHTILRVIEDGPEMQAALARAEYLVAGLPRIDGPVMDAAPNLKAVLKHGVGVDSIDIPSATARGIVVTSCPGANALSVAELAIGAVFALSRNLLWNHDSVASGRFERQRGREVTGATLGLLGLGQIGGRVARMALGVGMTVVGYDPDEAASAEALAMGVELADPEEVIARADTLSLHVTGVEANRDLIGAAEIARMKPGAFLVNYARGLVVDEDALAAALVSGQLAGAAVDAFRTEPPDPASALMQAPNVLYSPHTGADTQGAVIRTGEMVLDDIAEIETGAVPARALNGKELNR